METFGIGGRQGGANGSRELPEQSYATTFGGGGGQKNFRDICTPWSGVTLVSIFSAIAVSLGKAHAETVTVVANVAIIKILVARRKHQPILHLPAFAVGFA